MSFGRITLDPADKVFSQYIRLRDGECVRCHSLVEFNSKGLPVSHQASHYISRGKESTRFDESNVDCLCHGCHQYWGSADKEGYRNFKLAQLGMQEFNLLQMRGYTTQKKDRKLALIYWRARLKELLKEKL